MEQNTPIAIIGMGCFFPKASGVKEYWRLLSRGQDAITEVPETHWSPADYFDKDPKTPDHVYCKRGGFISPVPFDPTEFGIPPSIWKPLTPPSFWGWWPPRRPWKTRDMAKMAGSLSGRRPASFSV